MYLIKKYVPLVLWFYRNMYKYVFAYYVCNSVTQKHYLKDFNFFIRNIRLNKKKCTEIRIDKVWRIYF